MSERRDYHSQSLETITGYSQAIRDNLARIDAVLPLVPLPISILEVAEPESTSSRVAAGPATSNPPAPKVLLAPGGRVPTTKPRSTRRP